MSTSGMHRRPFEGRHLVLTVISYPCFFPFLPCLGKVNLGNSILKKKIKYGNK